MLRIYSGNDANEIWCNAVGDLMWGHKVQEGRDQETVEFLHVAFNLENPRKRFILSRPINPAFAFAELIWIMQGSNEVEPIAFWNPRMKNYSDDGKTFHGAYGYRLRKHFKYNRVGGYDNDGDQLKAAYNALKGEMNSRQVTLQIWDYKEDMPQGNGKPRSKDIPCNLESHLLVRDGKLEWCQFQRSQDAWFGFPYNIIQWPTLQEVMAGWLGIEVGSYVLKSDSFHIYKRHWEDAKNLRPVGIGNYEPDDLRLTYNPSKEIWGIMWTIIEALRKTTENPYAIYNSWKGVLPIGYRNMAAILCADAMRIKGNSTEALEFSNNSTNPAHRELYKNWWLSKEMPEKKVGEVGD